MESVDYIPIAIMGPDESEARLMDVRGPDDLLSPALDPTKNFDTEYSITARSPLGDYPSFIFDNLESPNSPFSQSSDGGSLLSNSEFSGPLAGENPSFSQWFDVDDFFKSPGWNGINIDDSEALLGRELVPSRPSLALDGDNIVPPRRYSDNDRNLLSAQDPSFLVLESRGRWFSRSTPHSRSHSLSASSNGDDFAIDDSPSTDPSPAPTVASLPPLSPAASSSRDELLDFESSPSSPRSFFNRTLSYSASESITPMIVNSSGSNNDDLDSLTIPGHGYPGLFSTGRRDMGNDLSHRRYSDSGRAQDHTWDHNTIRIRSSSIAVDDGPYSTIKIRKKKRAMHLDQEATEKNLKMSGERTDEKPIPKLKVTTPAVAEASAIRRKNPASFSCSFEGCTSTFTAKHNLIRHENAHKGLKLFRCDCGQSLTSRADLVRHQKNSRNWGCRSRNSSSSPRSPISSILSRPSQ